MVVIEPRSDTTDPSLLYRVNKPLLHNPATFDRGESDRLINAIWTAHQAAYASSNAVVGLAIFFEESSRTLYPAVLELDLSPLRFEWMRIPSLGMENVGVERDKWNRMLERRSLISDVEVVEVDGAGVGMGMTKREWDRWCKRVSPCSGLFKGLHFVIVGTFSDFASLFRESDAFERKWDPIF